MSETPDEPTVDPTDATEPEPPPQPGPPAELEPPEPPPTEPEQPRELAPTTWGGTVLAPRESDEEADLGPPRRKLGMAPMQWRYVLVMLVTGLSVVITLALFLLVIKLVAG